MLKRKRLERNYDNIEKSKSDNIQTYNEKKNITERKRKEREIKTTAMSDLTFCNSLIT